MTKHRAKNVIELAFLPVFYLPFRLIFPHSIALAIACAVVLWVGAEILYTYVSKLWHRRKHPAPTFFADFYYTDKEGKLHNLIPPEFFKNS